MGVTSIDLYRSGNKTHANLENIRIPRDADIFLDPGTGELWVLSWSGKGASTSDAVDPTWTGKAYRLPMNSGYPNTLRVWSDAPGHWLWAPMQAMLLSEFIAALAMVTPSFRPV
jgi:hypothetical protein